MGSMQGVVDVDGVGVVAMAVAVAGSSPQRARLPATPATRLPPKAPAKARTAGSCGLAAPPRSTLHAGVVVKSDVVVVVVVVVAPSTALGVSPGATDALMRLPVTPDQRDVVAAPGGGWRLGPEARLLQAQRTQA